MSKAKVLIVDGDEWIARMLADGLRDRSFDVRVTLSGTLGVKAAESVEFDCIVVDPHVPGLGGFAMVRALRRMKGGVAKVPVIFLSSVDNDDVRAAAFQAGGDVYLTKPFRLQEVAIQVKALVRLSRRMAGPSAASSSSLDSLPRVTPPNQANAIEADLEQMSFTSMLTVLEMERRSGEMTIRSKTGLCTLDIAGGTVIGARLNGAGVDPLTAIGELLHWKRGRIHFKPGDLGLPVGSFRPIGQLLLEATRLHDEAAAGAHVSEQEDQPAPSSRASWPAPLTWGKRRNLGSEDGADSKLQPPAAGRKSSDVSGMVRRPGAPSIPSRKGKGGTR